MSAQTIEFFWDAVSPYSYLAATQIEEVARRCGARLAWKPFLLGKTFEATGNQPPARVPAKGKYLFQDLVRWARHYQVPFRFPKLFPINTLLVQRVACALSAERQSGWAKAVMHAYWVEGQDLQQAEVLKAIADGMQMDGDRLLCAAQEPAVKDRLRQNTEEAVQRGAFGAPTFFVGEQMFWGNDRLVLLEASLQDRPAG